MNSKNKPIKVLVVDDSKEFQNITQNSLNKDPRIQVISIANNPYEARDKIIKFTPDVMLLKIKLPKMNGLVFLKKLSSQFPLPTIVQVENKKESEDAIKAGAVDFIYKIDINEKASVKSYINELITKIKIASTIKMEHRKTINSKNNIVTNNIKVIAIGASTGGTEATLQILKKLQKCVAGIVITQHMPAGFTKMYAERLDNICMIDVKEAEDGDEIISGRALIAPGDYQMSVKKKSNGFYVACKKGYKVNGHCPSVDVLFNSVAKEVKEEALGIILTGMGSDGAKGLLEMKKEGAITIGQNKDSCVVYGMPKVAYDIGAVLHQLELDEIAKYIEDTIKNN
ncbi:MAG: chemotaxis response regulator protein-glutamate methylesterase [Eubacteriales bacterium]